MSRATRAYLSCPCCCTLQGVSNYAHHLLRSVMQLSLTGNRVHWSYTGEEISRETIASGGWGRVRSVRGNHVVDRCHIDCELKAKGKLASSNYVIRPFRILTLAIAIKEENIIGAIQWTCGGPRLVQAKPNSPIDSKGATITVSTYFQLIFNIQWQ